MAANAGRRWTDIYPEVGTGPLAIDRLMSPEFYAVEREKIFRTCWLCADELIDIPEPGDFLIKDLPVCSTSILAVRGYDGSVRAFHNMCLHRGNKLAWEKRGKCVGGTLTCKFHGWCYDAAGNASRRGYLPAEGCEGGLAMLMANRSDRRLPNLRISKALLKAVKTKR